MYVQFFGDCFHQTIVVFVSGNVFTSRGSWAVCKQGGVRKGDEQHIYAVGLCQGNDIPDIPFKINGAIPFHDCRCTGFVKQFGGVGALQLLFQK